MCANVDCSDFPNLCHQSIFPWLPFPAWKHLLKPKSLSEFCKQSLGWTQSQILNLFCQQPSGWMQTFEFLMLYTLIVFCWFDFGCRNCTRQYDNPQIYSIKFSAINGFVNFHSEYWIPLDSNFPNSSEIFWKLFHVDTDMLIHAQILHPKSEMMMETTKPKRILDLLKTLWNHIQIKLKLQNEIHCKSMILPNLINLLNKHEVHFYFNNLPKFSQKKNFTLKRNV